VQAEREAGTLDEQSGTWFSNPGLDENRPAVSSGVGRYLDAAKAQTETAFGAQEPGQPPAAKKRKAVTSYGNFDAW